jgi:3',5'-cyclic AMP phosphodiesterase CpdA
MTVIAHLSDPHFGTEIPAVLQALQTALETLRPDLVIVSGDMTQRARKHEFRGARNFLDGLKVPAILVIPGNHDIPLFNVFARALAPYRNYCDAFGDPYSMWTGADTIVLALDSTSPVRHTRGKLRTEQLAELASRIPPSTTPRLRIACAHQPLHTAWLEDQDEVLIDAGTAADAFAGYDVDIVLSGHVHVPLIMTTHEAFPELRRHFILSGAGTAVSHRTRPGAPNSFNVITTFPESAARSVEVAIWRFDPGHTRFAMHQATRFHLGASGWEPI